MKNYFFYIAIGVILIATSTFSQGFWELSPGPMDYAQSDNDTTATNLKAIIRSHPGYEYYGPLTLLAYYHGATERSFILDSIRIYAYQDTGHGYSLVRYFSYQYVRGYLGDPGAFAGMDTVAMMGYNSLTAVQLLAENGYYNHFDKVQAAVPQRSLTGNAIYCLAAYSQSSLYRNQCRTLLASVINDTTQLGGEVVLAAEKLAAFDKYYASSLLLNRFTSADFMTRDIIWGNVNKVNPDIKVEMSKIALMTEPIATKSYFVPSYYTGIVKDPEDPSESVAGDSKKFLALSYIKFLKDFIAQQPPQDAKGFMGWFLWDFLPVAETTSAVQMLDTLISIKQQVASYGWVGDNAFVTELSNYLANARSALTAGDSLSCARQIFTFQNKVDEEYRDSLDGDTRTITLEGWKFLHYHSQYILERLSTITTLSLPINANWNMISLPLMLSDTRKTSIYPSAISDAFAYQNGNYVEKDTLKNGVGYWVKYPSSQNINYTGLKIDTVYVAVDAGWNMIGSVSQPIPTSKIYHDENAVPVNFFGFDGTYYEPDSLLPGKGYWIKVSGSGTLIIGKDASAQESQNVTEPPPAPDAPTKPVLQSPADGATGQSTSPILSWYAVEYANTYRLQAATDSNFYFVVIDQESITDLSYQVGPLSYNTKYYWHVKAYNINGYSYWSNRRSFTTQSPPSAPPAPTLASPANGATNISTSPTLSWNSSSGATSYRLQVSRYSGFSTLVFDNAAITTTSKQVSALSYSTIYYWRVNASNSNGTSAWSSTRSFTTQSAPSSDPCLPATSTASLDEFTISDANGNRQNLFVHNGGRGLHLGHPDYDLPPETPKGAFHARFKSGKFVEIIPPNKTVVKIPIKVKDVVLPVTLQWKVQPGNKVQYWLIDQKKSQKRIPLTGSGKYSIDNAADNLIYIEAQASEPCITN